MKTSLLVLSLLGLALAGCNKNDSSANASNSTLMEKAGNSMSNAADSTKAAAVDAKDAVAQKMTDWKLTPADIKADLVKSGQIVREKAAVAGQKVGETFDKARIVTVINAKLVGDSELSALKIDVAADQGVVTLNGTVKSPDLIGRAILLALDTDGVNRVVSQLTVSTP